MAETRIAHFKTVSEQIAGAWQMRLVARCSMCGTEERMNPVPHQVASRWLSEKGWADVTEKTIHCSGCAAMKKQDDEKKRELSKAQKRAVWLKMNGPTPKKEASEESAVMAVEAPRQPTRDDNRRISEALDTHYDIDRQCYHQNFTDESLSAKLSVPRVWIERIREQLYGPNISASKKEAPAKLKAFEGQLAELIETHMTAAAKAEEILREVRQMAVSIGYQGAA